MTNQICGSTACRQSLLDSSYPLTAVKRLKRAQVCNGADSEKGSGEHNEILPKVQNDRATAVDSARVRRHSMSRASPAAFRSCLQRQQFPIRPYFGRHSTLKATMICAGSALPMLLKSSKPLLSLAPASFKLPSSFDLAALQRSSFENSWNTTVGRSLHSALSFVAAGLTE